MPSCERCWQIAKELNIEYEEQLRRADREGQPCVKNNESGRRLRAGQFWDEKRKIDTRNIP